MWHHHSARENEATSAKKLGWAPGQEVLGLRLVLFIVCDERCKLT